jgi:probable F420-dependent oxidoreductase
VPPADHKPFRFSVQIPGAEDLADWTSKVKRAEDHGFYSVSMPDHLGPMLPQLAPMVALGVAAAVTSRLRLAITVLDNDFRHPVMLAKEIATLDVLSGGRVDMGLGAGWLEEDYSKTGITTWDPPGVRVSRLAESIALVRALFAGEPVTFAGDHYRVQDFRSYPTPVQSPVPLLIGGGGKRILSMAAREAQIISILVQMGGGAGRDAADRRRAAFEQQLAWIAAAGGDARDDLTIGVRVLFGKVGAPNEDRAALAEALTGPSMSVADVLESPFGLVGDLPAIRDHLEAVRAHYGVNYFTVSEDLAWQVAPLVAELSS